MNRLQVFSLQNSNKNPFYRSREWLEVMPSGPRTSAKNGPKDLTASQREEVLRLLLQASNHLLKLPKNTYRDVSMKMDVRSQQFAGFGTDFAMVKGRIPNLLKMTLVPPYPIVKRVVVGQSQSSHKKSLWPY